MQAYEKALAENAVPAPPKKQGTIAWLFFMYKESAQFSSLAPSTQRVKENVLIRIEANHGAALVTHVTHDVIRQGHEDRASKPEAANTFLKVMRSVFRWAKKANLVDSDPTRDIEFFHSGSKGFPEWTEADIKQFELTHPLGTKSRLAFDLLIYTGLRRSDVVRIGRQHEKDGVLTLETQKTGVVVDIAIAPELQRSIDASQTGDMIYLVTECGKPYTANGFGNWFRRSCREAGILKSAHGIRKAAAIRVAENGGTTRELTSLFGWSSAKMADHYTQKADRKRLGVQASAKLSREQ